ncbi:MAG: hypothetical protein IKU08_09120 [Clostridia bacterium]|nr:hypothetical protein [Clostridia bacterium]
MTKKRFVKLLMSYGVQRNEAQQIARDFNGQNIPYKTAYPAATFCFASRLRVRVLVKGFKELSEAIRSRVIPALDKLKEAVAAAYEACDEAKKSPRPDYGQTPKTTRKPYIKPITKSRSREGKK